MQSHVFKIKKTLQNEESRNDATVPGLFPFTNFLCELCATCFICESDNEIFERLLNSNSKVKFKKINSVANPTPRCGRKDGSLFTNFLNAFYVSTVSLNNMNICKSHLSCCCFFLNPFLLFFEDIGLSTLSAI